MSKVRMNTALGSTFTVGTDGLNVQAACHVRLRALLWPMNDLIVGNNITYTTVCIGLPLPHSTNRFSGLIYRFDRAR